MTISLAEQFRNLKTAVGGNREITEYENSFGMPKEEREGITPPTRVNTRIFSELEFALGLSEGNGGRWSPLLSEIFAFLTERLKADGVLTDAACAKAEEILSPMEAEAKTYRLILAGHAHIDMNWMWSYTETVSVVLATFRTVLKLMEEYPQFCFSQSQASVYRIAEEYAPELMEPIRRRIAEGRWEVTASAWVETDQNMPGTESLLRHIGSTREYLSKTWGVKNFDLDFSPDTFGHSANIPEIDSFGGVKYFYHCRGLQEKYVLYRWRGLSGKELLAYREPCWYNSGIRPWMAPRLLELSRRCAGLKTGLVVYGVGDHGGGPTRRDVERGMEMQSWKIFPRVTFGTFREFFREAETVREKLPVVSGELNYFATGCYTTQSRIKLGNRRCEAALREAEALSCAASFWAGAPYARGLMENAWRGVLFTHFHDILTGSCVQDSREHAMGLFQTAMAAANTQTQNAMLAVAAEIDTSSVCTEPDAYHSQSEGAGAGYGLGHFSGTPGEERGSGLTRIFHIFSTTARARTAPAELTVWDWRGDPAGLRVTDFRGNPLPFQLLDASMRDYWSHRYFRVLVDAAVPALGYTTVILSQEELKKYPVFFNEDDRVAERFDDAVLENDRVTVKIASGSGRVVSFVRKDTGEELIAAGKSAGLTLIDTEAESSDAWRIGRYVRETEISMCEGMETTARGTLRRSLKVCYSVLNSKAEVTYSLDAHADALRAELKIDWNETAGKTVPVLSWCVPLARKVKEYRCDIPAGTVCRPAVSNDVPSVCCDTAVDEQGGGASLFSDCKYGFRGDGSRLCLTLINSAGRPDPYPERGIHHCTVWLGAVQPRNLTAQALAESCLGRLISLPGTSHGGKLPMENGFLALYSGSTALVSLTPEEGGAVSAVLSETSGCADSVKLEFTAEVKSAEAFSREGVRAEHGCAVRGNCIELTVPAFSIRKVRVEL